MYLIDEPMHDIDSPQCSSHYIHVVTDSNMTALSKPIKSNPYEACIILSSQW